MDALLSARSDKINNLYTTLPKTSPTSITDLAHSLTDQYDNNYDKAKAVESYLNSFPYTYIPDLPTENEDLVAYFCFRIFYLNRKVVLSPILLVPWPFYFEA